MAAVTTKAADRFAANLPAGAGLLLFYGPNAGLIDDLARTAIACFAARGKDQPEQLHLDCDLLADEPGRLLDEVSSGFLFGGRRVLRLKLGRRSPLPAIVMALPNITAEHLLIIDGGDLKGKHAMVEFCKAESGAAAIACYDEERAEWAQWLDRQQAAMGMKISAEARVIIEELHGKDRGVVRMELEKLAVYAAGQPAIEAADVAALSQASVSDEYDQLVDAALAGDVGAVAADRLMLAPDGAGGIAALGFLTRQLHLLRGINARRPAEPLDLLMQRSGVFFRRAPAVRQQLDLWPVDKIDRVLAEVSAAVLETRRSPLPAAALAGRALLRTAQAARERL